MTDANATGSVQALNDGDLEDFQNNQQNQQGGVAVNTGKSMQINVQPGDNSAAEQKANQAALDKANAGTDPQKLIAGKFKTQEDFDKSILEAVKKKHGDDLESYYNSLSGDLSTNAEGSQTGETQNTQQNTEGDNQNANADNSAGDNNAAGDNVDDDGQQQVDLQPHVDDFVQEFTNDGKLSDNSYQILEQAGYDKTMVDTYMAGVAAQRDALFARVGGQDSFFQMTEWAGKGGMSEAQVDNFNNDINSGDVVRMEAAMDNLAVAFRAAGQQVAPNRIQPNNINTGSGVQGYTHIDQLKADQADPRYQTDASFREQVKEKLRLGSI